MAMLLRRPSFGFTFSLQLSLYAAFGSHIGWLLCWNFKFGYRIISNITSYVKYNNFVMMTASIMSHCDFEILRFLLKTYCWRRWWWYLVPHASSVQPLTLVGLWLWSLCKGSLCSLYGEHNLLLGLGGPRVPVAWTVFQNIKVCIRIKAIKGLPWKSSLVTRKAVLQEFALATVAKPFHQKHIHGRSNIILYIMEFQLASCKLQSKTPTCAYDITLMGMTFLLVTFSYSLSFMFACRETSLLWKVNTAHFHIFLKVSQ